MSKALDKVGALTAKYPATVAASIIFGSALLLSPGFILTIPATSGSKTWFSGSTNVMAAFIHAAVTALVSLAVFGAALKISKKAAATDDITKAL